MIKRGEVDDRSLEIWRHEVVRKGCGEGLGSKWCGFEYYVGKVVGLFVFD